MGHPKTFRNADSKGTAFPGGESKPTGGKQRNEQSEKTY